MMDRDEAVDSVERATGDLRSAQEALERSIVMARGAGATWSQIGDATGMSRQSAHERWGHIPRAGCQREGCACPDHAPNQCGCGHGPGRGHRGRQRAGGA